MSNLFNISADYLRLMDRIEAADGEITEEDAQALQINKEELEAKIKAYYYRIKETEGDIQLIRDEMERLTGVIETKNNFIKRLKDNVNFALNVFGEDTDKGNKRIKFKDLTVWNQYSTSTKVDEEFATEGYYRREFKALVNDDKVEEFRRVLKEFNFDTTIVAEVNKPITAKIKADLESGIEVNGAELVKSQSVRFK